MFTLFKRDLKSLITKPFSLAVFVLLFLVPAIIFSVFLSLGIPSEDTGIIVYAGFENLVSVTGLFMALVIPAVVVYSLRRDRKNKNFDYFFAGVKIIGYVFKDSFFDRLFRFADGSIGCLSVDIFKLRQR